VAVIFFLNSSSPAGAVIIAAERPVAIRARTRVNSDFPVPACGASTRANGTGPAIAVRTIGVRSKASALAFEASST